MESGPKNYKKKDLTSRRGQGGGPSSKVNAHQWEQWREVLQAQPIQHWTRQQLAAVLRDLTGVGYSNSHFCGLLRHQQGLYYYKPRPQDYRRKDGAEEQLRARIQATFDALQVMGHDLLRVKWGFADEVAAQLHTNNRRFWALEPHLSRVVNTDRSTQSFFGFYGINATSALVDLTDGTLESIQQALLAVKQQQQACDALVIFWDNARSHTALETWGWERQIYFVPLPTYSPDLNPIEKVWKSVKRWVNAHHYIRNLAELGRLFRAGFDGFKDQLTFTSSWWALYADQLSWYRPIFDSTTL